MYQVVASQKSQKLQKVYAIVFLYNNYLNIYLTNDNYSFKPVFLSNIFAKSLKEEKQAEAEVSNMELSKDI